MTPHQSREEKNKKYAHISLEMETSTHFPYLIEYIQKTDGPILEVGSGVFSTPLIHWLCFEKQRPVITAETHWHYLEFAKKFETSWHKVLHVPFMKDSPLINEKYSVVFIDHTPKKPQTRGDDAILFANNAEYVVMHDAGAKSHHKYGYENAYKHFKYRRDWTGYKINTTVLSNFHEL